MSCNSNHNHSGCGCDSTCHATKESLSKRGEYIRLSIATAMLIIGIALGRNGFTCWGICWLPKMWYLVAYFLVASPIFDAAWDLFKSEKSVFNELTLMIIATIGAFYIGEYPEAVTLMILYCIGEILQGKAVEKARNNIRDLIDLRPDIVRVVRAGAEVEIHPSEVRVGELLRLKVGERVSLDGTLTSGHATLDMSALTGESKPCDILAGQTILAGSIVLGTPIEMEASRPYAESTLAKILKLVEESVEHKSKTETFIRKFARIYTPIVTLLALLIVLVPYLWSLWDTAFFYDFQDWFYRGLVFLVTSCPCALVIGVPLAYFAGIGNASKHGLLFKGSIHLDKLRNIRIFALDKTGTVTKGSFDVTETLLAEGTDESVFRLLVAVERHSTHPIAQTICKHFGLDESIKVEGVEEVAGLGLKAHTTSGQALLVGSPKMMSLHGVELPERFITDVHTFVVIAIDGVWKGAVMLDDMYKENGSRALSALHKRGVADIIILSGDRQEIVDVVAAKVGADRGIGGLLPQDKVREMQALIDRKEGSVAFVGDGLNDAPVMAMSDLSFAMGAIGSDAAIEAADVVIRFDDLMRLPAGMDISRFTHRIVLQNIIFALTFKVIIMVLAAVGIAPLTLAIVADVGVSLLVVLNAMRVLKFKVDNR
ncbi:heavy metal translocating P-type ATPase [Porphyromonas sp.]|uniref:heavy metal translocating P-type ATPase n=1 Tax=Porphyromonas sp. TaxID=1924944 RepID=UPI0026DD9E5C|nr:heavy metal translocating P-type ATPase [Porphyromonas sp.]MDO4770611.1 heavy metal translocating P-type ATPase [Porphyromonas sp.]